MRLYSNCADPIVLYFKKKSFFWVFCWNFKLVCRLSQKMCNWSVWSFCLFVCLFFCSFFFVFVSSSLIFISSSNYWLFHTLSEFAHSLSSTTVVCSHWCLISSLISLTRIHYIADITILLPCCNRNKIFNLLMLPFWCVCLYAYQDSMIL